MIIFAPDYYTGFKCIADKCRHSCCIGWEIDVDQTTVEKYQGLGGEIGKMIMSNLAFDGDSVHIITDEKERCPFLNSKGLCDIITELGEGAICGICREHPRFRNTFSDRTEIGLGLCCEEAARIILLNEKKVSVVSIGETDEAGGVSGEDEDEFFKIREGLLRSVQDRELSVEDRFAECESFLGIKIGAPTHRELAELFGSLEYMDAGFLYDLVDALGEYGKVDVSIGAPNAMPEQAAVYFIYRHLADGIYCGDIAERFAFSAFNTRMLMCLCSSLKRKKGVLTQDDALDIARRYSSEIEYSEDNTAKMIDFWADKIEYLE